MHKPEVGQTVFVTRYALSGKGGLPEKPVMRIYDHGDSLAVYLDGDSWTGYRWGRDAFPDRASALSDVETRRKKKIASLQKQIAKLEKMVFA